MSKDCLYVAVLLVIFINNVKTDAYSNDLDPSGSLDHENMEFDDSLNENDSNIESSFNNGIHFADDCKCDKGKCVLINGKLTCTCPPEFGVYRWSSEVKCLACECGKGVNCTFNPGFWSYGKNCVCPFGFKYIEPGKKCDDACTKNQCKNNGTCEPTGKSFKCNCKTPFFGEICDKILCDGKECQNGATLCNKDKKCDCLEGWTGDTCEEVDGCTEELLNICEKLSLKCVYDRTDHKAICNCTGVNEIFNGKHCTVACDGKECQNGAAECNEVNKCNCLEGWTGDTCAEVDGCNEELLNVCEKLSLQCVYDRTDQKAICNCTGVNEKFNGKHCTDPCTPSPCKNAGLCEVVGIDFNCTCKASYFGKQCEIEIDTTEADATNSDRITTGAVTTNTGEITTNTYECYCGENSVSCLNWLGGKLCFCKDGYDQRRGSDICSRTCQSNADCRNDGICDREGPGYFCMCREPFIGDRCELDVCNSVRFECRSKEAECVRQGTIGVCKCPMGKKMSLFNYCEDICTYETCVHGTCELTGYNFSQYVCNCYEGYYGRHCENAQVMQYTPDISILVILASGIVLFSITSIVAGCWVRKLRKKIAENTKQTGLP